LEYDATTLAKTGIDRGCVARADGSSRRLASSIAQAGEEAGQGFVLVKRRSMVCVDALRSAVALSRSTQDVFVSRDQGSVSRASGELEGSACSLQGCHCTFEAAATIDDCSALQFAPRRVSSSTSRCALD